MNLPVITNSAAKSYRRCPRLYQHRYVECARPVGETAEALSLGLAVHAGLEHWWLSGGADMTGALVHLDDLEPYLRAKGRAMLAGYAVRWTGTAHEVVAVEYEFCVPLVNPDTGARSRTYELAGKVDGVVRIDGELWIVEHKTSGEDVALGSPYWQKLALDTQISTYMAAVSVSLGERVVGCIYDVLRKPTLRPYKATPEDKRKYKADGSLYAKQRLEDETAQDYEARLMQSISDDPLAYYARGEQVRMQRDATEAAWDLWQLAKMLRESERLERFPRNPDACFAFNRACDYWDVCSGQADIHDPNKFEKTRKHSELSEVTNADAAE